MNQLEARLEDVKTPLNVAVIGCVVNGPERQKRRILDLLGQPRKSGAIHRRETGCSSAGERFFDELESMIRQQAQIKEQERAKLIAHWTDTH